MPQRTFLMMLIVVSVTILCFVYSGQDSAKNLWGKHRDSMRRPEIDGRQAFCLKRKSRFRENRLTDYRLTVDSYLKILLQQEHRQLFPTL